MNLEPLEPRRLLSAVLRDRILTIIGTEAGDTINVSQSAKRLYLVDNGVNYSYKLGDVAIMFIDTGVGNDKIRFNQSEVTIRGRISSGRGNDSILGGKGDDSLFGGDGHDTLHAGDGNDFLDGHLGRDDISGGAGARDIVDYRTRSTPLTITLGNDANDGEAGEGDNVHTDAEIIYGGKANDRISTTSSRAVKFFGYAGNDTLIGGSGNDLLDAGAGRDSLEGNAGNDILLSFDAFADTLHGGSGSDTANADINDTLFTIP